MLFALASACTSSAEALPPKFGCSLSRTDLPSSKVATSKLPSLKRNTPGRIGPCMGAGIVLSPVLRLTSRKRGGQPVPVFRAAATGRRKPLACLRARSFGCSVREKTNALGSDMAELRFDDGAAYENMMGIWSRKVGVTFLDW